MRFLGLLSYMMPERLFQTNSSKSSAESSSTPLRSLLNAKRSGLSTPGTAGNDEESARLSAEVATLEKKVMKLTDENEKLRSEKKSWLTRLQADNRKLGQMYQDVDETKRRLIREIDNIQTEKARLKSLQLPVYENAIDSLLKSSRLAPSGRKMLPVEKRAQAADLFEKLTQLVAQCRENQAEVLQVVSTKAQEVDEGFQNGTASGNAKIEAALNSLRSIAATVPGNLLAAEAVAQSLSEAMVLALMDKSSVLLSRRADVFSGSINALSLTGASVSDAAGAPPAPTDMKALQAQNESLRSALLDMRKRNAQLLAKAQENMLQANKDKEAAVQEAKNKMMAGGSSPSGGGGGGGGTGGKRSSANAVTRPSVDSSVLRTQEGAAAIDSAFAQRDFLELPEASRGALMKVAMEHVLQQLRTHPLARSLKEAMLRETAMEIATQVSGLVGTAIKALGAKGELDLRPGTAFEEAVTLALSSPIRKFLLLAFTLLPPLPLELRTAHHPSRLYLLPPTPHPSKVSQEVASLSVLTLTYLCSRVGFPDLSEAPPPPPPPPAAKVNPRASISLAAPASASASAPAPASASTFTEDSQASYYDHFHSAGGGRGKGSTGAVMVEGGAAGRFSLRPEGPSTEDKKKKTPGFMQSVAQKRR